jgi:electron transfer flavoprotein alpha subunit
MSTVLVVSEVKNGQIRKSSLEAVTAARKLADGRAASVSVLHVAAAAGNEQTYAAYGADRVLAVVDGSLENYHADLYKRIVLDAIQKSGADVVLLAASNMGRDLAPRVAAGLQATCVSDVTAIAGEGDSLVVQKPMYAGKILAKLQVSGVVKIVSLRPGVFPAEESRSGASAAVEAMSCPAADSAVTLLEVRKSGSGKLDVSDADIVVTGGRGVRAAEHFGLLEELAQLLGGAVGATRAVVDSGWRPHGEQVGQTGKVVSPSLYLMFGASGSIQHWAGMSGSKCIVAVNKDSNAPILQRADYSIVGDLFEVLPALTEEIKKIRG